MALTEMDAARASNDVLNKYGEYLPLGVAGAIRAKDPKAVVKILPAAEYRPQFDEYFRSFFAAINAKAFGTKKMTTIANSKDEVCGTFNCPAFCAPAIKVTDRVIYINKNEDNTYATVCHEMVHYISHPNFYPEFYAMGGENPKILEGVTEYLTRSISSEVAKERREKQKYQAWFDNVNNALIKNSQGDLAVIKFALRGEYVPLLGLGGVEPGRAPLAD